MNKTHDIIYMVSWEVLGKKNAIMYSCPKEASSNFEDIKSFDGVKNCNYQEFNTIDFSNIFNK